MNDDRQLEGKLRQLSWPVDRGSGWAGVEAQARKEGWVPDADRPLAARVDEEVGDSQRPAAPRTPASKRMSRLRIAVFASIAVLLAAAVTVGTLEAVKYLSKDEPVLVIGDEPLGSSPTGETPQTTVFGYIYPQTPLTTPTTVAPTLGRNWEHLPLAAEGGAVHGLVMDPTNPAVLYAITDWGLFKSTDGAAHWTKLPVEGTWWWSTILVDPSSPSTLYTAGLLGPYRSLDGGATWTGIGAMAAEIGIQLWWIDSSTSPSTLWGISDQGWVDSRGDYVLFKSADGGSTWEEFSRPFFWMGPEDRPMIDPINHMLYAIYGDVGMRSLDGGVTWEDISAGLPVDPGRVVLDPRDSSRLYLYPDSYPETLEPPVFVSTDKAQTWTELTGPELDWARAVFLVDPATPVAAIEAAAAFLTDFDGTVIDASSGVQVSGEGGVVLDPGDPSVVYMGTYQGVYKSTDQGATWNKASLGMTAPAVHSVLVDPLSPTTIYATTLASVAKSTDGGASWATILELPLKQRFPETSGGSLLLAPSSPTRLYAASPNGLLRSDDGGVTWTQLAASGLPKPTQEMPEVDLILVASDQPDTVFAKTLGDSGCGLYRSTDGGNTWDRVAGLPDSPGGMSLIEAPDDPSRLYAGVVNYWEGEGPAYNGFFKSTDGGKTWNPAGDRSSWGGGISALAIDPHNPLNLYAAAVEGNVEGYLFAWHSTDGGETWTQVIYYDIPSLCGAEIIFDPRAPGTLYALTIGSWGEGLLYRSTDEGTTWQDMTEGHGTVVSTCVIDPATSNGLYAATNQGLYKLVPDDE